MAENRSRDMKYFNCSEEHELRYVSGLYTDSQKVYNFLREKCADNTIKHSTHKEVYELIEKELELSRK